MSTILRDNLVEEVTHARPVHSFPERWTKCATMSSLLRANLWGPLKIRISRLLPILLILPGCRLLEFDSCLYELRSVSVEGRVTDASTEIPAASESMDQPRHDPPDKFILWPITS